jgi:hypothetical protein
MFSSFSSSTSPTDRWKTTPVLAFNRTAGKGRRRRKKRNVCIYRRSEEGKKSKTDLSLLRYSRLCFFFSVDIEAR